jgi:hypothetical protein
LRGRRRRRRRARARPGTTIREGLASFVRRVWCLCVSRTLYSSCLCTLTSSCDFSSRRSTSHSPLGTNAVLPYFSCRFFSNLCSGSCHVVTCSAFSATYLNTSRRNTKPQSHQYYRLLVVARFGQQSSTQPHRTSISSSSISRLSTPDLP